MLTAHLPAIPLLLVGSLLPVAAGLGFGPRADTQEPDVGFLGFQPPEVTDVRVRDALPHQDQVGGSNQNLIALTGARGGGFAAFWRDQRDGILGLYLARLGPDLAPREPERPTYEPHTARRTDPSVALASDGSGAVAWTSVAGQGLVVWIRTFDAEGRFQGEERAAIPPVQGDVAGGGRGGEARAERDVNCRAPTVLASRAGVFALAFTRGPELLLAEYAARGDAIAQPIVVNAAGPAPEPGVWLAAADEDGLACVWTSAGAAQVSVRTRGAFETRALPPGTPRGLAADPTGGFWVLLARSGAPSLVHLASDGRVDREAIAVGVGATSAAHLAVFEGGVAVLAEAAGDAAASAEPPARGGRAREAGAKVPPGSVRLLLFDPAGVARAEGPFVVPSNVAKEVQNARLAADGARLLVGWTDTRNGDPDVFARLVDPRASLDQRLGPEQRLNTDRASSDQIQSSVAAHGERGLVSWIDKRATPARAYARRVTRGGFEGDEIALPLAFQDVPAPLVTGVQRVEAALRADGTALVCWKQVQDGGARIAAQILGADGGARSLVFDVALDPKDALSPPAVTALAGERGFLVAWAHSAGGVWSRRVLLDGRVAGAAKRVSEPLEGAGESEVALALLADGRPICAWTSHTSAYSCRVRFLDDAGEPRGGEIELEHWKRANDWDPALAPAADGGFLVTWTSGWLDDSVRDVCARLYDARGNAKGPILQPCKLANEQDFPDAIRLADGSFAVAWEDDISYYDQVYVRRVAKNGKELGPIMRLDELETLFVPDRVAPRIAALGDGFVAVFGDRRRSLGLDVRVKIVGPRFDDVPREGARKR